MDDCIFSKIVKGEVPSRKVCENDSVYAFLDIHPVNKYHTLVIPKKHYENSFDTPDEELREIMTVIKKLLTWYKKKLGIENIQIVNSNWSVAQQDVFHTHYHIVPRYEDDGQNIRRTQKRETDKSLDEALRDITQNSF